MRDGDRILSVDGMVVNSVNFDEALMSVYTPDKSGVVELIYSRKILLLHREQLQI